MHEQHFYQPFKKLPRGYPKKAHDCLYTFTARDWMLNDDHRGKHEIKTREDLIVRAANDENLKSEDHNHVLLLHDQNGMTHDAIALIAYFYESGFEFLDVNEG